MAVLFGLFIFLLICIVASAVSKDKIAVKNRVKKLGQGDVKERHAWMQSQSSKSKDKKKIFHFKITDSITNELFMANIMMRPEEFIFLWLILIFVPGGLVALLNGDAIPSFFLIILGTVLPPVYVRNLKRKRVTKFENQLGDALAIISNCLRSGLTFQQAMGSISKDMPDPIAQEFARTLREIQYGNSVEKALTNMSERLKSPDLILTVSAILIQRQVGGNLAEILDNISETIKERLKIKNEIKVLTATGRISGIIIGMLPIALGVMLLLLNPDYIKVFFTTPAGNMMLGAAVVFEAIGFVLVKKIITIKY